VLVLYPDYNPAKMTAAQGAAILRISYGSTSFLFTENAPPSTLAWLAQLDASDGLLSTDMKIASGTPAGVYVSNGTTITKLK
jgi:hypothetical protein